MEFIRLTERTAAWFRPLLPPALGEALRSDPRCFAVGAVEERTACGALVFRQEKYTVEIVYLAVSEPFRRRGAARGMLRFLCDHAYTSVTPVRCTFSAEGKTAPLYLLFAQLPYFTVTEAEGYVCRVERARLASCAVAAAPRAEAAEFFSLPSAERGAFWNRLEREGAAVARGEHDRAGAVEPLCLCTRGKNGPDALTVVRRDAAGRLLLSLLYAAPGAQRQLPGLLAAAIARLDTAAAPGEPLYAAAVNQKSIVLLERLLPEREIVSRFYEAYWDMDA